MSHSGSRPEEKESKIEPGSTSPSSTSPSSTSPSPTSPVKTKVDTLNESENRRRQENEIFNEWQQSHHRAVNLSRVSHLRSVPPTSTMSATGSAPVPLPVPAVVAPLSPPVSSVLSSQVFSTGGGNNSGVSSQVFPPLPLSSSRSGLSRSGGGGNHHGHSSLPHGSHSTGLGGLGSGAVPQAAPQTPADALLGMLKAKPLVNKVLANPELCERLKLINQIYNDAVNSPPKIDGSKLQELGVEISQEDFDKFMHAYPKGDQKQYFSRKAIAWVASSLTKLNPPIGELAGELDEATIRGEITGLDKDHDQEKIKELEKYLEMCVLFRDLNNKKSVWLNANASFLAQSNNIKTMDQLLRTNRSDLEFYPPVDAADLNSAKSAIGIRRDKSQLVGIIPPEQCRQTLVGIRELDPTVDRTLGKVLANSNYPTRDDDIKEVKKSTAVVNQHITGDWIVSAVSELPESLDPNKILRISRATFTQLHEDDCTKCNTALKDLIPVTKENIKAKLKALDSPELHKKELEQITSYLYEQYIKVMTDANDPRYPSQAMMEFAAKQIENARSLPGAHDPIIMLKTSSQEELNAMKIYCDHKGYEFEFSSKTQTHLQAKNPGGSIFGKSIKERYGKVFNSIEESKKVIFGDPTLQDKGDKFESKIPPAPKPQAVPPPPDASPSLRLGRGSSGGTS